MFACILKNGGVFSTIHVIFLAVFVIFHVAAVPAPQNDSCVDAKGKAGICTTLRSCPHLMALLRTAVSDSDKLFLRQSQCSDSTPDFVKICCSQNENPLQPEPTNEEKQVDGETLVNTLIPSRKVCGTSFEDKIVGGTETELDEFPWMALLEYTKENGVKSYLCGGALITDRYILTAAHCLPKSTTKLTSIRLGEWNLETSEDCSNGICSDDPVDIPVESVTIHQGYESTEPSQKNDIALVRMQRPVKYTAYIRPICLPLISKEISQRSHVGNSLVVSGWGKTETAKESQLKLKVEVPVVEASNCISTYKRLGLGLADTQFCAGGKKGLDSCNGDSGGPLMVKEIEGTTDNWFIRGIVSFGPRNCGTPGYPGVYTDVSKYGQWISENIKP